MSSHNPTAVVTAADAPEIVTALPCGCRLPFERCAFGDALLDAEWNAGDVMLRVARLPGVTPEDYAAARANWQAARRAYDEHIGRKPVEGAA